MLAVQRRKRTALALAAICALTLAGFTGPAHAATGSLTGVITEDGTGAPLADVWVTVVKVIEEEDGRRTENVGSGVTDAAGRYEIADIPAAPDYRVELNREGYVREFSHDHKWPFEADHVAVPGTLDEGLAPVAVVSGVITDENGAPVRAGTVSVNPLDDGPLGRSGWGEVGEDGRYTVTDIPAGSYQVEYSADDRLTQYFHGTFESDRADALTFRAGPNTLDEKLLPRPTGVVSGTVTDAITGRPIEGICVEVGGVSDPLSENQRCTDSEGRYRAAGLTTRATRLYVDDEKHRYVTDDEYPINTVDGKTITRHLRLTPASSITALLVDAATGKPAAPGTACLRAVPLPGKGFGRVDCIQKKGGKVTLTGLRAGTYTFEVDTSHAWDSSGNYGSGWVKRDSGLTAVQSEARSFTVGVGKAAGLGKVKLVKGGSITGIVTDNATGKPVERACVGVGSYGTRSGEFSWPGDCTDAEGRYTVKGLVPGDWVLQVAPINGSHAWAYSGGAATRATAARVPVAIDATSRYDITVSPGASTLTGTVTATTGATSYNLDVVNAADSFDYASNGRGGALPSGKASFEIPGIAPQRVKIRFWAGDRAYWYGGKDFATAMVVTLKPGTTTVKLIAN